MSDVKQQLEDFRKAHGHYGLVRTGDDKLFAAANPFALPEADFPPVDYAHLPESAGVKEWQQVENQASVGSCQGHAKTDAEELAIYRATGQIVQLNRAFSYWTSQQIDGIRGDVGSTISGGCKASQKYGTCLESIQPYTGRYVTQFSKECFTDAATRKLEKFMALPNYDAVLRWLYYGIGGIVIGIQWDDSCEGDADGKVERHRPGPRSGGHALSLLDWNTRFRDAKNRPYIARKNSWGINYSQQGWDYIHPDVIEQWCHTEDVFGYGSLNGTGIIPASVNWRM